VREQGLLGLAGGHGVGALFREVALGPELDGRAEIDASLGDESLFVRHSWLLLVCSGWAGVAFIVIVKARVWAGLCVYLSSLGRDRARIVRERK
jgi:hypothetical protein